MASLTDLIGALDGPAALIDAAGAVQASNDPFDQAAAPGVLGLAPGERLEIPRPEGGSWIWRAKGLAGGERLLTAEAGAVAGAATRERYLAALSHELRTPLNGVLGMAGLLARTRLDHDQKAYVAAVRDSGEHLLGLVNDVLDLAKLESGALDLEPHPVDLERLLQGVTELLSPRAHDKGLQIAWAAEAGLPQVMADDGRIRQILFNLAGNAVKFTETGGVLLTVARAPHLDGLGLRFTVADTGPGVPEADQARIFEEFARLGPQARLEGAGLGLAIVRRLAQAHGGAVGLANRPEGGSAFWFEASFAAAGQATVQDSLSGVRVAVVSPSAIVRAAACAQVEACGGQTLAFEQLDGAAARDAVVLVDSAVEGAEAPPPGQRAIVLLNPEERDRIDRCRKAGYAGYLIKPLRRASVAERVLAVIDQAGATPGPAAPEDDRVADEAGRGLRILLAEDNPINALLARTLLEREGCAVDRAANGREAVEAARGGGYDLILMDVRMPVMDGVAATLALRALGCRTPIVALTADAFDDDRKACLGAGMNDFLTKPLELAALRALLGHWTEALERGAAGFTADLREAKVAS